MKRWNKRKYNGFVVFDSDYGTLVYKRRVLVGVFKNGRAAEAQIDAVAKWDDPIS